MFIHFISELISQSKDLSGLIDALNIKHDKIGNHQQTDIILKRDYLTFIRICLNHKNQRFHLLI